MNEQQDKNPEQQLDEAPTADAGQDRTAGDAAGSAAPAARRGGGGVAWLALLLAIALGAGLYWFWQEQRRLESELDARLQAVRDGGSRSAPAPDLTAQFNEVEQRLQQQLQAGIGPMQAELERLTRGTGEQDAALQSLRSEMAVQRAEIAGYQAVDREAWLLAEVRYLLRLANQRLVMAGDTAAAQALLSSADKILQELDDPGLHGVRAAVAADLAALRAVPTVDVEGVYLGLSALIEQAGKLVIFQLPQGQAPDAAPPAEGWRARLRQGWERALEKLSSYIIIRRRDVPMQALMDPQWEGLVRQNLQMLLQQAQVALLSGNGLLYRESLQRAQVWVEQFFDSDETAARAIYTELTRLVNIDVAAPVPDISRSLDALDEALQDTAQPGEGE